VVRNEAGETRFWLLAYDWICPLGPVGLCPEGLNDRSQAIYCLVSVEDGNRPVGHGMIGSGRLATIRDD
jgi:hypothetical protein